MAERILFSGYFGFGNTGDEAIIEALCQEVRRQDSDAEISVLLDNAELAARLQVRAYPRRSVRGIISALRNCDLLISGGGGLLQDTTGLGSVVYYLGIIALARMMGRPAQIMCQGFGPVRRGISKLLVRCFLPWAVSSTWRDENSLAEVRRLAPKLEAKLSADPALLLEPVGADELARIKEKYNLSKPFIVVALRRWTGLRLEDFTGLLGKILAEQPNLEIVILPFQESQDGALAEELRHSLDNEKERVHLVKGLLPRQILSLIGEAEMVLAMRLHALIFAAGRGVPFLGAAYDPKVGNFCGRCGMPCLAWKDVSFAELEQQWRRVWDGRDILRKQLSSCVEPMRSSARQAVSMALQTVFDLKKSKQRGRQ